MACLDMFNNDNGRLAPRISFSNDFVDTQQLINHEIRTSRSSPAADQVSSDFEFSVSNYNMMAADELFSKGRLLPFKPTSSSSNHFQPKMTLREELLHDEEGEQQQQGFSSKPPKAPSRWKELLGLKRSHIVSKKPSDRKPTMEEAHVSKSSQEMVTDGESSCPD